MSKHDVFQISLMADLKKQNMSLDQAAEIPRLSPRQFYRHFTGNTREGIMPTATLGDLRKANIASEGTVTAYFQRLKELYQLKKAKREAMQAKKRKRATAWWPKFD